VKQLEEFYNKLDRSQDNVEKLQVCEAVAWAEFYTNQILVNSDEDLVYRINLMMSKTMPSNVSRFLFKHPITSGHYPSGYV
jgi:hypothetical protein